MSFAGLWERWQDPETGVQQLSATIIVCPASKWISRIHDRMPVILEPENVGIWLHDPRSDLLVAAAEDVLQEWPVTPRVNTSRYQEAEAVLPLPMQ